MTHDYKYADLPEEDRNSLIGWNTQPPRCMKWVDPRDPAFEPKHKWIYAETRDGTSFHRCERCGAIKDL